MEVIKSYIKEPNHFAVFFYRKVDMDFIGSYSISENYLYNLHVMENKRNRGYGLKMLEHAKTEKKDLILDVDPENEIAIRCYKKCGFIYKKTMYDYHHPCWGPTVPIAEKTDRYVWKKED